jgi:hypothetical protein
VGGYDGRLPIMEDADLCIRLHMTGTQASADFETKLAVLSMLLAVA